MSVVTQHRRTYSNQQGNDAARRFVDACRSIGYQTRKSTREEDMYDHIDYWVKRRGLKGEVIESSVDVKGCNHPECIWIEFKNVAGDNGWLYGRANYIAFEWDDHFRLVRLIDLQVKVHDLTKKAKYVNHKSKALYNYYDRSKWGNKDLLTQVTAMDIWWITEHVIPFCNQLELDNYRERTFKRKY